jgi:hypothetical protein
VADIQTFCPDTTAADIERLVLRLEMDTSPANVVLYFDTVSKELHQWLKARGYLEDPGSQDSMYRLPVRLPQRMLELDYVGADT